MAPLSPDEARTLDGELAQAQAECGQMQGALQAMQAALKAARSAKSLSQVQAEAKAARGAAEAAEAALAAFQKELGGGPGGALSAADEARCRKDYVRLRKAWLERKRNCMDVLSMIGEHRGVRERDVMNELGLETDEDAGVQKASFPPL